TKAVALELAASVAYSAALAGEAVGPELVATLRQFQRNHQDGAEALLARIPLDEEPGADPGVIAQFSPADGADEAAILTQLASLEEALAATYLDAIDTFDDSSFAKLVS